MSPVIQNEVQGWTVGNNMQQFMSALVMGMVLYYGYTLVFGKKKRYEEEYEEELEP
jgi:hypothetical protein